MNQSSLHAGGSGDDKYELILHKYDWRASRPPRGYLYGIGRGAKAFITTAELTVGASNNNAPHISDEESKFFNLLDAIEQRKTKKDRHTDKEKTRNQASVSSAISQTTTHKLSWEELSSIEKATVGVANTSSGLIPRNARDEAVDAAEEYAFADETHVITAQDVLQGKVTSSQANLQRILTMGSTSEQATWITHSRAYREMGMMKKALSTLIDGCAATGKLGSLIWKERLRYIPANNELAIRRVLEEATLACPTAEELWVMLIKYALPHERISLLQRAVLACPSSELLWVRVLNYTHSAADQRKLIQRALQHNPSLPKLWARLARLETLERGKAIFRAASRQYSSFELSIEAITFVEWSLLHSWKENEERTTHAETQMKQTFKLEPLTSPSTTTTTTTTTSITLSVVNNEESRNRKDEATAKMISNNDNHNNDEKDNDTRYEYEKTENNINANRKYNCNEVTSSKWDSLFKVLEKVNDEVDSLVRQASQTYLTVNDAQSRQRWLHTAFSAAKEEKCIWTCAFMLAYMVLPTNTSNITHVDTSLLFDDLVQLLSLNCNNDNNTSNYNINSSSNNNNYNNENEDKKNNCIRTHEEYCALWGAWVICVLRRNRRETTHITNTTSNSACEVRRTINDQVNNAICTITNNNNNNNSSSRLFAISNNSSVTNNNNTSNNNTFVENSGNNVSVLVKLISRCVSSASSRAIAQVNLFLTSFTSSCLPSSSSSTSSSLSLSFPNTNSKNEDNSVKLEIKTEEDMEPWIKTSSTKIIKEEEEEEQRQKQQFNKSATSQSENNNNNNSTNIMSLLPLTSILTYTLGHDLLSSNYVLRLLISYAFFNIEELYLCLTILRKHFHSISVTQNGNARYENNGICNNSNNSVNNNTTIESNHGRVILTIAEARVYAALHLYETTDATLQAASALAICRDRDNDSDSNNINRNREVAECNDIAWYLLALHRRSLQVDVRELLKTACVHFPHSTRLWLMRLHAVCHSYEAQKTSKITVKQEKISSDDDDDNADHNYNNSFNNNTTILQNKHVDNEVKPLNTTTTTITAATGLIMNDNTIITHSRTSASSLSLADVREMNALCQEALSEEHCKYSVQVWIFVALHVNALLIHDVAAARALLLDATLVCCPNISTSSPSPHASSFKLLQNYVLLGIARAKLELMFGVGSERANKAAALDMVHETLQKIPKTRDGLFLIDVSELLQMHISLEPLPTRGRVAATVMKMYKPRDALVLMTIAKLYHAAGHFEKALEQAIKAVQSRRSINEVDSITSNYDNNSNENNSNNSNVKSNGGISNMQRSFEERLLLLPFTSTCVQKASSSIKQEQEQQQEQEQEEEEEEEEELLRSESINHTNGFEHTDIGDGIVCGDAVAMLWKLALLPEYKSILGLRKEFGYSTDDLESMSHLPKSKVEGWVWSTAFTQNNNINSTAATITATQSSSSSSLTAPMKTKHINIIMYGPLWKRVSEEDDPSNITLLGYRDSTKEMLEKVMSLIVL